MSILFAIICVIWGFASGLIISTGILSFINAIGIIPRMAERAKVKTHYYALANASLMGSMTGTLFYVWEIYVPIPKILISLFALAVGVFVGCVAVAIAEILNIIPISKQRLKIKRGAYLMILAFGIGKMVGTLFYYLYPGFY